MSQSAITLRGRYALAAEWTKLWTVRSTAACLTAAAALVGFFAVVDGLTGRSQHAHHDGGAMSMSTTGAAATGLMFLGQFAVIALAALVISTEYSTTSIRTTLQCVPVRTRMLAAKTGVLAPVCLLAGAAVTALGVVVARLAMGGYADPVHAGAVAGLLVKSGGYMALTAVTVIGIGALVRSVAGTIVTAVLLVVMLPMMLGSLGVHALEVVAPYLPGGAGGALLGTVDDSSYGTAGAVGVLIAWAVLSNVVGVVALRRRDA